ncbi:uncharacterized protein EAF02_011316 [Botrytis sinoallii]|uniref:uncharacterized protein n=1 Tax=Botrytis sinoallii TaxID=1463999 RepID=UPI0018FF9422|nr:uncharacterized protein EAF02_011316 [Botrytis sinoallii]KAF7857083.1 hypothetical protein EAF02_011316 [Botrytis sinoallii]
MTPASRFLCLTDQLHCITRKGGYKNIRDSYDKRGVFFSHLDRLIEVISHSGRIDDLTIKPKKQDSFPLIGFSRYTLFQVLFHGATLSTAAEEACDHIDVTRTQYQKSRTVDGRALASRRSVTPSSDGNGCLSDSDSKSRSDDDGNSSEYEP